MYIYMYIYTHAHRHTQTTHTHTHTGMLACTHTHRALRGPEEARLILEWYQHVVQVEPLFVVFNEERLGVTAGRHLHVFKYAFIHTH